MTVVLFSRGRGDPEIADSGWVVWAGGPVLSEPVRGTSTGQLVGTRKEATVAIVELGKGNHIRRLWHFTLKRNAS